jgi:hypothetical protein
LYRFIVDYLKNSFAKEGEKKDMRGIVKHMGIERMERDTQQGCTSAFRLLQLHSSCMLPMGFSWHVVWVAVGQG